MASEFTKFYFGTPEDAEATESYLAELKSSVRDYYDPKCERKPAFFQGGVKGIEETIRQIEDARP